nr:MAG TPA: hypothetical protein [Caudoviricetes sp.]
MVLCHPISINKEAVCKYFLMHSAFIFAEF